MAKHARKVTEGQQRRLNAWHGTGPVNGMHCPKPGSQNRKRSGFGKGGKR